MTPASALVEQQHIVRKRTFRARSIAECVKMFTEVRDEVKSLKTQIKTMDEGIKRFKTMEGKK